MPFDGIDDVALFELDLARLKERAEALTLLEEDRDAILTHLFELVAVIDPQEVPYA